MGATGTCRDAVHVAAKMLVSGLGPLEHQVELQSGLVVIARYGERLLVHWLRMSISEDLLQGSDGRLATLRQRRHGTIADGEAIVFQ